MTERYLFGGSAADVAEDVDGSRIAGAPVTIWDGPADTATRVLDLVDVGNGAQMDQSILIADEFGFIPPFLGPPCVERLWAKAGSVPTRVELVQMSLADRFNKHTSTDPDPHKDREYTDRKVAETIKRSGQNEVDTTPSEAWLNVETASGTSDVFRLNRSGDVGTRLKSDGTLHIRPFTDNTGLVVLTNNTTASTSAISVQGGTDGVTSVFQVRKNGNVSVTGTIQSDAEVIAPNVGSARVFSGPVDPGSRVALRPGDVWVKYG
ncbi:hypothetical protein [Streptomyces chattanoogensis]|uniref:hypothetical protein n=1 Tax=Streptomyces chattanoogensis TaxID=66876 RepID=UPI003678F761